jgi:DNA-binding GntR family transcriptional regulator
MSRARTRFEAMHGAMRERICLLVYPPGARLAEEQLARELGVSRTPIRRVLARLESEGLVESRHGHGTVVTNPDLETLRQIYQLRMRHAELIGELDPLPRDEADLERVRALLGRLDRLATEPDGGEYSRINMAFHQELLRMIGNAALRDASERLYYQTARLFLQSVPVMDLGEEVRIFRSEIVDILAAMERDDARAVGFVRRNHIAMSFHRMTKARGATALASALPVPPSLTYSGALAEPEHGSRPAFDHAR